VKRGSGEEARRRLETEILPFEAVRLKANSIDGWIRSVRQATGFPTGEMGVRLRVDKREIFRLEVAEKYGRIDLGRLRQLGGALDCELVYAFVPRESTFEELAERERAAKKRARDQKWLERACKRNDGFNGAQALRRAVSRLMRKLGIRVKRQGSGIKGQGTGGRLRLRRMRNLRMVLPHASIDAERMGNGGVRGK
jgi:hypothetical protein